MFRKIWAMWWLKVGRDLGEAVTLSAWENVISNQAVMTAGRPQGLWPPLGRTIITQCQGLEDLETSVVSLLATRLFVGPALAGEQTTSGPLTTLSEGLWP